MPLHLLGKKSWNVYNSDNIERVRRDEAVAREREHAEEQRLQEIDADRRLAILRGEVPPPLPSTDEPSDRPNAKEDGSYRQPDRDRDAPGRERKKRKRQGEDDTDFEMRLAQERASGPSAYSRGDEGGATALIPHKSSDAPLTDVSGHIDLFGGSSSSTSVRDTRKNAEAEAEKARKKREYEDQYTMRFSNAAGLKAPASGPWYAPAAGVKRQQEGEDEGKDAFGRPDPGRKDRDVARIVSSDPLAMMRRGAAKVREVEKERKTANEERERETRRLHREERRREKKRRRRDERDNESDGLEGFSLDTDRSQDRRNNHTGVRTEAREAPIDGMGETADWLHSWGFTNTGAVNKRTI
ncbi:hypothetical protein TruAng_009290 [Truncatella angustata]|nr:hypothetical protein TruAng_009290 [Truncatella angustata]